MVSHSVRRGIYKEVFRTPNTLGRRAGLKLPAFKYSITTYRYTEERAGLSDFIDISEHSSASTRASMSFQETEEEVNSSCTHRTFRTPSRLCAPSTSAQGVIPVLFGRSLKHWWNDCFLLLMEMQETYIYFTPSTSITHADRDVLLKHFKDLLSSKRRRWNSW